MISKLEFWTGISLVALMIYGNHLNMEFACKDGVERLCNWRWW